MARVPCAVHQADSSRHHQLEAGMSHRPGDLVVWQLNVAVHPAHADLGSDVTCLEPAAWTAVTGAVASPGTRVAADPSG